MVPVREENSTQKQVFLMGGDCLKSNAVLRKRFQGCFVTKPDSIGNGVCDGGQFNTEECGFDGGDYKDLNCTVAVPSWIGDGFCDGGAYLTESYGLD